MNTIYLQGGVCIRVPNGCKTKGTHKEPFNRNGRSPERIRRVKSPFDFICSRPGKSAYIDVKSIQGSTFPRSAIKYHQAEALNLLHQHGHKAGYLVFFISENQVIFFSAIDLLAVERKDSLSTQDGILFGDIENFKTDYLFI